ncbi:hypothetical protein M427DRAFT_489927 [Gonapodya prolifera JEL478]|uniref:Pre-mRNA-splicing factor CWC26 n=1 Tax=Gonapodya prolifera (strain JEL478) TaxID=1344416 RepID=A0A138ZYH3_GONPJ|nr:hypothetical protein M427DRAFT_489927 [Gonapodya prolifera JEL478]|eukprot:KXS09556.1 hypothetical protein M427DRAFT_489927 [Gonapodya prolifera JEL478]
MSSSSLQAYLAKNYLSGPPSSKSSKRKSKPKGTLTSIVDEDADDWKKPARRREDDDEDAPVVVMGVSGAVGERAGNGNAEEAKKTAWKRVGGGDSGSDVDEMEGATIVDLGGGGGLDGRAQQRGQIPRRRHDSDSNGEREGMTGTRGNASIGAGRRRHDSDSEGDRSGAKGMEGEVRRKRRRHDSDSEGEQVAAKGEKGRRGSPHGSARSPPRRRHDSASPEHNPIGSSRPNTASGSDSQTLRMADGTSAGLQRAADLAREAAARRKEEDSRLRALDSRQSGKDAATVYRDKSGRKVNPALERAEELERQRKEEAEMERQMQWGRGVAQLREAEERRERARGGAGPLARYANDRDMNEDMKSVDRWGDPMAGMVKKKAKVNRPLYKGPPPPPNRFGILPGYRWDGVDRSNGFEGEFFKRKNQNVALKEEAYKWSAEDMDYGGVNVEFCGFDCASERFVHKRFWGDVRTVARVQGGTWTPPPSFLRQIYLHNSWTRTQPTTVFDDPFVYLIQGPNADRRWIGKRGGHLCHVDPEQSQLERS